MKRDGNYMLLQPLLLAALLLLGAGCGGLPEQGEPASADFASRTFDGVPDDNPMAVDEPLRAPTTLAPRPDGLSDRLQHIPLPASRVRARGLRVVSWVAPSRQPDEVGDDPIPPSDQQREGAGGHADDPIPPSEGTSPAGGQHQGSGGVPGDQPPPPDERSDDPLSDEPIPVVPRPPID